MTAVITFPVSTNLRNTATPTDPTDTANKAYVDSRVGGTVFSAILSTLTPTLFAIRVPEGVGNTVIYVTNDSTSSTSFAAGQFLGFASTDPYGYLIALVTNDPTPVPAPNPAPYGVTTITLASPLRFALAQGQIISTYALNPTIIQRIIFDPNFLVANDNGNFYIQSKYNVLYGTTAPAVDTFGFLGQLYVQDTSTAGTPSALLFICLTADERVSFTWVQISGGGGGSGQTFGTTTVFTRRYTEWIDPFRPQYPTAFIPSLANVPNSTIGVTLIPFRVSTNEYSVNTGRGTIDGIRYIEFEQTPSVVEYGVGMVFPTNISVNSDIYFEFTNFVLSWKCRFTTPLQQGLVFLRFMISPASIITDLESPYNRPIKFLDGGNGTETFLPKSPVSIIVAPPDADGNQLITATGGDGFCYGDSVAEYIGSTTPYYFFLMVGDGSDTGLTNTCLAMYPITIVNLVNQNNYTMTISIGLQGNTGSPTPSGGTITSRTLTVTPSATTTEIEVPNLKAIPFYNTVTPGQALASIGSDGTLATTKISITNTSTSDPISTGGVGTVTVGNQGDTILNTSTIALWVQVNPPVIAPVVQTYNWIRVNTSPTPPPAGVTSLNALTGIVNAVAGTNILITTDPITKQITFISTATGPANPLTLYSDTRLPPSGTGQNGDFYLQYNTSATPFLFYRKNETQWIATSFFGDIAQNNSLQLAEKNTFADLLDGDLFPDFSDASDVATALNVATTTTRLSFINLYMSIITTGVSDANVGILQSKLKVGLVLQADGGDTNPVIGSWQLIITSVTPTGNVTNQKTVTILGHLKPSDDFSLNQLKSVTTATISNNIWTYNGGGIFVDCEVPLFVGYYLGYDPVEGKVTYLALPPPPAPTKLPSDIQTFYLSVDSNGQAGTVLFDTVGAALGTAFGTMSNGVFTASRAVKCFINISFNVSGNPDAYGFLNANLGGTRYNAFDDLSNPTSNIKNSVLDYVEFASGDNYRWNVNNAITVTGGATFGTRIQFKAEN